MLTPATSGGPRRCKASLWLQPRAPRLPSLGRIHSAQGSANPAFGHWPRQAAVTAFGPYLFSGSIRKTSAIEIKGFPARPESIHSCNRRRRKAAVPLPTSGGSAGRRRVAQGQRVSGSRWFPLSSVRNQQAIQLTRRPGATRSRPAEPEAKLCRPPVAGIAAELRSPETERQQP